MNDFVFVVNHGNPNKLRKQFLERPVDENSEKRCSVFDHVGSDLC